MNLFKEEIQDMIKLKEKLKDTEKALNQTASELQQLEQRKQELLQEALRLDGRIGCLKELLEDENATLSKA